jgi:ribA/ribD-fused uncharacterized protein
LSNPYTREELIAAINEGRKFQYLFFWGHRQSASGEIGPTCCSQWFPVGFEIDGIQYKTAEHYMMAEKARLFADMKMEKRIIDAPTPNDAKGLGRKVAGFNEEKWKNACFQIVVKGNTAKFSQNPRLKSWLLKSSPLILVESSPVDPIWGIGLHQDDPASRDPFRWNGTNLLGFALTLVRDQLLEFE